MPYLQPALGVSPFSNSYIATSAETSEKNYAYSGNISPQGMANGYGPAGSASQDERRSRVQGNGSPGLMQARSEPFWHPSPRYLGSISPYGSNTDSRPNPSPMEQIFAPLNNAPSFSHPEFSTTCANCRNRFRIDGVPDYHPNQRDSNSTTDWTFQGPKNYFLRQTEGVVPSNRQLPNQDTRRIAPQNDHLDDVPHLEESRSRFSFQKPAVANVPDNLSNVHADKDAANDDLPKKRKRKSRIFKPRKPRTLTEEGKAHAKAIRECPGGACADCRIKKTKAREPPVTNSIFNTLITVPSALTSYPRTYPWICMISGLQTPHGLSP